MYRKRIIIYLLLSVLVGLNGCKSFKLSRTNKNEVELSLNGEELIEKLNAGNICRRSFEISKMSVDYFDGSRNRQFKANMKYSPEGKVLISLRSFAGIEAARIFISNDSIKINDRINKIHYTGTTKKIVEPYGLDPKQLSILFGDAIDIEGEKSLICSSGMAEIETYRMNKRLSVIVNCNEHIIKSRKIESGDGLIDFYADFNEIKNIEGYVYPGEIKFGKGEYRIGIVIEKIGLNDELKFKFSVGKEYEIIDL